MDQLKQRPGLPFDSEEIRELRYLAQKPYAQEALEAWLFHRRISIYISRALLGLQWITPNLVTFLGLILASSGAFITWLLQAENSVWAGLVFYHLAYLLDVVDGELARLKDLRSDEGIWLDRLLAEAMNAIVLMAAWKYAMLAGMPLVVPVILLALGLRTAGRSGYEQLRTSSRGAPMAGVKRKSYIVNLLSMLSSPGGLLLWLALGELTGFRSLFLTVGVFLFLLSSIYQLLYYWKSLR